MTIRIAAIDDDLNLPAGVRAKLAGNLTDPAQPEGAALNSTIETKVPVSLPIVAFKDPAPTLNVVGAMPEDVTKVGSTYWLLYTQASNGTTTLCLASSSRPNGPWTPYGSNPILTSGSLPWETPDLTNGGGIVEHEGTFYLFYATDATSSANPAAIGVATASAITGPYTKQPDPILERGAAGAWDSRRVQEPDVIIAADGTWVMAYMAETLNAVQGASEKIGIATATNPLGPWTKAPNNPVIGFGPAGEYDQGGAADPSLHYEDGLYWCLYSGLWIDGAKPWQIGFATATDPLGPWTRHPSGAAIPSGGSGAIDAGASWRGAVFIEDGVHHVTYGAIPAGGAGADAKGAYAKLVSGGWKSDEALGDSGWRTIFATGAGDTMPGISLKARRIGDVVDVVVAETVAGTATGLVTLWPSIPVGFRPAGWKVAPLAETSGQAIATSNLVMTASAIHVWATSGKRHYGGLTYTTTDPWPSTLPGTAG